MPRYIALLRGINVGGNTMIKMEELRTLFEALGFENVVTYINSGNIAFDHDAQPARGKASIKVETALASEIEDALEARVGKRVLIMVREQKKIPKIIAANPFEGEFSSHKEMHVLFLKEEVSAEKISLFREMAPAVERFVAIGREIYCHLPKGVANSVLGSGLFEKKLKMNVTARNWRTVEKLAVL